VKSFWQNTPLHLLIIIAVGLWVLVPGTGHLPLIDRDEPRFARAAVEMRESGSWLVPTFNGQYRFDKPPLIYALIRASMAVWGENEMGARSAVVVCALLVALALYGFAREMTGAQGALLAALAWLTCLQVWIHGRLCLADMPMILCVLVAQWALWRHLSGPSPPAWKWTGLLYIFLALGFAAKGPIALVVPLLTVVIWRFLAPDKKVHWRNLRLPFGLALVLVLTAAWGLPVLWATQGKFWNVGIGEHVVRRGFQPFNGRFPLPFYYFLTIWISLLPWACFIPAVLRFCRGHWDRRVAFLASWLAAPVLVFSFYATQLPHYILPGLLAFFVLLGMWWNDRADHQEPSGRFPAI
jgi:4-amino-4-deoxy-L-arabinose transferase-like glycosyltransferase